MQKVNVMSNWWTPTDEDEFKNMENILLILSTVRITTATDFYITFQDEHLRDFICEYCDSYKSECACNDDKYMGIYSPEYDDE